MPELLTHVSFTEDATRREKLDSVFRAYNDEKSAWHKDIRTTGGKPFDIYLEDKNGELMAGLYGESYWQSMEIDRLWVHEDYRHQGLGSQLLQKAIDHARAQQCRFIHLTTFSFQAPDFYQKHGFKVVGQLLDMPPGFAKYWLRKDLE